MYVFLVDYNNIDKVGRGKIKQYLMLKNNIIKWWFGESSTTKYVFK